MQNLSMRYDNVFNNSNCLVKLSIFVDAMQLLVMQNTFIPPENIVKLLH